MISIQQDLLFLNLSHKGQLLSKRFEAFLKVRTSHKDSQLVGFYPSRDLYSESTWSVYEIRHNTEQYIALIWDYHPPAERNLPQGPYFEMRPVSTTKSYLPIHAYSNDSTIIAAVRRLHPKLLSFINVDIETQPK